MKELQDFYTSKMKTIILIVPTLCSIVISVIAAYIEQKVVHFILMSITSSFFVGFVFYFGNKFIKNFWWMKSKKNLYFKGKWHAESTYFIERKIDDDSKYSINSVENGQKEKHFVVIKQDCLKIQIMPSSGNDVFSTWESLSVNIISDQESPHIHILYKVEYIGVDDPIMYGYEEMSVSEFDKKGYPCEMIGKFYHCALPNKNLLRGTVIYTKRKEGE